jgi:ElaB/YqjD/DUF883 family membrane-anchored ribosome-binding protein
LGTQNQPPLMPSQVSDGGKDRGRTTRTDYSQRSGEGMGEQAAASSSRIVTSLKAMRPRVEQFCRERPLTAIGIGILVGMVLRSTLSRR